jgi:hypothetical protein
MIATGACGTGAGVRKPWGVLKEAFWFLVLFAPLADISAQDSRLPATYPLMRFSEQDRHKIMTEHLLASKGAGSKIKVQAEPPESVDLLPHIVYNASDRDQGNCGDCWQWAGTGVMEVALDVQHIARDRLSVQLLNSCYTGRACCDGGWLFDVADFYSSEGFAIPWANANASFSSGSASCDSSPCGNIAQTPCYAISNISMVAIPTWNVGQTQAIANIKSALSQGKAVFFAFYLANDDDWSAFFGFWNNQPETTLWTNFYCGQS